MVREIDVVRAFSDGCANRGVRVLAGPGWRRSAGAFLKWCAKNSIDDPLGYLTYWFKVGDHEGHEPKIHRLRSARLAKVWHEWQEGEYLEDKRYEKLKAKAGTATQQEIKALCILTRGHEAVKARYSWRRTPELCLAEIDLTGGFHPESSYCARCLVAVRCSATLYQRYGFDVVSLRAGRLRDLPAYVAAAAVS